jgi:hypothetical protein
LPDENPGALLLAAHAAKQMAREFRVLVEQALVQMAPNSLA